MARSGILICTALAALALVSAYVMQFGFGLEPCRLCYWQRYPYFAAIAVGLTALLSSHLRIGLALMVLLFFTDAGIAAYHAGIEAGFFELPQGCAAEAAQSMQDMMATLAKRPAQCDQPAFEFLGLTLSMWNALAALAMAIVAIVYMRREISPQNSAPQ